MIPMQLENTEFMPGRTVVLFTTLPAVGGNSTITLRLARQFRSRRIPVWVVAKEMPQGGYCEKTAAELVSLGCRLSRWPRGRAGLRSLPALIDALQHESTVRETILVGVGMRWGAVLLTSFVGFLASWFYMIQHDDRLGPVRTLGPLVRIFDGIGMISTESIAPARTKYGRRPTVFWLPQFSSVGGGRDVENSARPRPKRAAPVLGFLGQLTDSKGVRVVLDLWRSNADLPSLVVVGDGPLRAEVEAAATRDSRVDYRGGFSAEQSASVLPAFFSEIDLLLVPITREGDGIPTVILESVASGVPVLCSDLGGLRAFVRDLKPASAGVIEAVSLDRLPSRLATWLHRPPEKTTTADACRAYYAEFFDDQAVWRHWRPLIGNPFTII